MKKIIFFIIVLTVFSCKKEDSKTPTVTTKTSPKTESLIYSSDSIEQYLQFNAEYSEYELVKLTDPKAFTEAEVKIVIKENDFGFNKSVDFKYYTPFTFTKDNVNYSIIAYNSYGENDSKVVNIQLNSFVANKQIDALLLDCRFTFETEYYRDFRITQDGTITIKKLAIDGLNYNDDGDIVGEKKVKDTTSQTVRYKMNTTGTFTKM